MSHEISAGTARPARGRARLGSLLLQLFLYLHPCHVLRQVLLYIQTGHSRRQASNVPATTLPSARLGRD
jgi:hypothetical protein